eukprot:TRINITY_DN6334_c0_g1_i1.p1 TRINITY_DN6334_c0_g1~~TRINITY_DN6334_c0_g1_i1.p1  ORF type:complete len:416 (-),score=32.82 TRINITY_DN6334_c0_g1_i1:1-1248(-)
MLSWLRSGITAAVIVCGIVCVVSYQSLSSRVVAGPPQHSQTTTPYRSNITSFLVRDAPVSQSHAPSSQPGAAPVAPPQPKPQLAPLRIPLRNHSRSAVTPTAILNPRRGFGKHRPKPEKGWPRTWKVTPEIRAIHERPPPVEQPHLPPAKPRIAILTPQEGASSAHISRCTFTKQCYAKKHGYEFILDTSPYARSHGRHPTWNRIPSSRKNLPRFDWILHLDSDIAIVNHTVKLEDFVSQFHPSSYVVYTEAVEGPNCGGFFIRNVPWSFWWLDKWWAFSKDIKSFAWNDQIAAWDAIVHHFASYGTTRPLDHDIECKSTPLWDFDWRTAMICYASEMEYMGLRPGNRSGFHIEFWPQTRRPRGFTFFYAEKKTTWLWPRPELFMKGDFVIHTHSEEVLSELGNFAELKRTCKAT